MPTLAENMFFGLQEIWAAFTFDLSILWILAPIIIIWLFSEIYFGMFKSEKLGWNNVLGNGVTLLWIGVDAMRYIFSAERVGDFWPRFIIFGIMIIYSIFLIDISFTRKLGETISYALGSPTPIYYLSSVAVLWSYGQLQIDRWVFLDFVAAFILVLITVFIFRKLVPQSPKDITDMYPQAYPQQTAQQPSQPTTAQQPMPQTNQPQP